MKKKFNVYNVSSLMNDHQDVEMMISSDFISPMYFYWNIKQVGNYIFRENGLPFN